METYFDEWNEVKKITHINRLTSPKKSKSFRRIFVMALYLKIYFLSI
jgi:hypothetical protein